MSGKSKVKEVHMPVVFQHEGPVTTCKDGSVKFLLQHGHRFTNAEYNRFDKKWEPEPEHLGMHEVLTRNMLPVLEDLAEKVMGMALILEEMLETMKTGVKGDGEQDKS